MVPLRLVRRISDVFFRWKKPEVSIAEPKQISTPELKQRASELLESGDHLGAISVYRQLERRNNDDWHLYIGSCHFALRQYEVALYYLRSSELSRGRLQSASIKILLCLQRTGRFTDFKRTAMLYLREEFAMPVLKITLACDHVFFTKEEAEWIKDSLPDTAPDSEQLRRAVDRVTIHPSEQKQALFRDIKLTATYKDPTDNFQALAQSGYIHLADDAIIHSQCNPNGKLSMFTYWDTFPPRPEISENVNSWKIYSALSQPLFSDQTARDFILEAGDGEILSAYDSARHPAMKSDIFRLLYLFEMGGLYIDADQARGTHFENLRNFPLAEQPEYSLGTLMFNGRHFLQNGFIFCREPKSELMYLCLEKIRIKVRSGEIGSSKAIAVLTGPSVLTEAFIDLSISNPSKLARTAFISRSVMDLVLPEGGASYKKDPALNWRGN